MNADHHKPVRAWQRMLSGRKLDLLDPDPADIAIEDIAHGLARVARWNGQTRGAHAFSVAQHCLIVDEIANDAPELWGEQWRLAALLHDGAEYVIGDLISPFKTAIGLDYKAFEIRLMRAIHTRFGLPDPLPDAVARAIKSADRVAAYFEATRLAGFSVAEAEQYFGSPPSLTPGLFAKLDALTPVPAKIAQRSFLELTLQLCLQPNTVCHNLALVEASKT
jgi:5'-deoxynucleotidase YfbR-like HD superfamily hydrolase